ncbi:MAG: DUF167 domain-containing protein [Alphaproteobacteria bacterium]|uniref:DUF167 domain-containing protein n=1 Tax=Pacificispira sp. TaxID=2888761 RepID=UPI002EA5E440|nr:DUF167 domain-containing protein [Pseudomonadota bacterium]
MLLRRDGPDGLRLTVKLTPKAAADRIAGPADGPDATRLLKVQVTAPPVDGKANAALIRLLAKTFKCPKTSLKVVSGATDRTKVVAISGDPEDLAARIAAALGLSGADAKIG